MGLVAPQHAGSSQTKEGTPALAGGFLTTGPPRKPLSLLFVCVTAQGRTPPTLESKCGETLGSQSLTAGALSKLVIQSLSRVQLSVTPWTAARQASLFFTVFQSLLKLMSTESVMPSNHLSLCHPLLLLPSIFPSIRIFFSELALRGLELP